MVVFNIIGYIAIGWFVVAGVIVAIWIGLPHPDNKGLLAKACACMVMGALGVFLRALCPNLASDDQYGTTGLEQSAAMNWPEPTSARMDFS